MKNHSLVFRSSIGLLLFLFFCLFLGGCAPKRVDPLALRIQPSDQLQAKHPPTSDELIHKPHVLLPLIVFKDLTVTDSRESTILFFVHDSLKRYANIDAISQEQTRLILNEDTYRNLDPSNVSDAIQIGSENNADFVSQIQIFILESRLLENTDTYKANINLTVFKVDTGQAIFKTDLPFSSDDREAAQKVLKKLAQTYFKLKGYIIETRGDREMVKISLGKSLGIEMNRQFEIRERSIATELVRGLVRKRISHDSPILATAKVVNVSENSSWLLIKKGDREKIRKGQVVFALPEKSSLFSFMSD